MTQCHRILPLGKMGWDIATEGCKIASHLEKAVPGGFLCWEDAERGGGRWLVTLHHAAMELVTTGPCGC